MTPAIASEQQPANRKSRLHRLNPGWFVALLPLSLTLFFAGLIGRVAAGEVITFSSGTWWIVDRTSSHPHAIPKPSTMVLPGTRAR